VRWGVGVGAYEGSVGVDGVVEIGGEVADVGPHGLL
jgi:hypothetical protein